MSKQLILVLGDEKLVVDSQFAQMSELAKDMTENMDTNQIVLDPE